MVGSGKVEDLMTDKVWGYAMPLRISGQLRSDLERSASKCELFVGNDYCPVFGRIQEPCQDETSPFLHSAFLSSNRISWSSKMSLAELQGLRQGLELVTLTYGKSHLLKAKQIDLNWNPCFLTTTLITLSTLPIPRSRSYAQVEAKEGLSPDSFKRGSTLGCTEKAFTLRDFGLDRLKSLVPPVFHSQHSQHVEVKATGLNSLINGHVDHLKALSITNFTPMVEISDLLIRRSEKDRLGKPKYRSFQFDFDRMNSPTYKNNINKERGRKLGNKGKLGKEIGRRRKWGKRVNEIEQGNWGTKGKKIRKECGEWGRKGMDERGRWKEIKEEIGGGKIATLFLSHTFTHKKTRERGSYTQRDAHKQQARKVSPEQKNLDLEISSTYRSMAVIWKILLGLVAVASLLASQASAGGDREAAVGLPAISGCRGTVGECLEDEDEEFALESESTRRILTSRRYISYGALQRNSVPCSRRGASYYNCRPGAQANPYRRSCSAITRCRS
ncbi:ralf-like 33 [Striga asiatica]|uniref:Ralf-like 33 n=1 Tax=Striga asiatica TaxID=4170 RepID=A0A5A7QEY4_STRAF|nr:ralf-like 33 [Striga asiatica]